MSAGRRLAPVLIEALESRQLLAATLARPDHIVVVIEQDRLSNAIGNRWLMPYLNELADSGLVYSGAHGVTRWSQPNMLALYSGSTQGVVDNTQGLSFPTAPNIAKSLFDAGLSFSGYVEDLPSDGSQVHWHPGNGSGATHPDQYVRYLNPMAMFGDVGIDPATKKPRPNSAVNRTFAAFRSFPTNDYSGLPTVSFIVPNNLHSSHGSNWNSPWAGSADPNNNNYLRAEADKWLRDNLDPYVQWAKQNNSLLIVTQDEEVWQGEWSETLTTLVTGDPDLFVPGINTDDVDHYRLLRTITDMYGLAPLGQATQAAPLDVNAAGQLIPDKVPTSTTLASSSDTSAAGETVTFTATVDSPGGTPVGVVRFMSGSTLLATRALDGTGKAVFATTKLGLGSHAVKAVYVAGAAFSSGQSATLTQTVIKAATTTTVSSSENPSIGGQAVSFTATLSAESGGTPTGTIQFLIDGVKLGGPVSLVNGAAASVHTDVLGPGHHAISAVYSGDATHASSTSGGTIQLVILGPANNDFGSRTKLSGSHLSVTGTNEGAGSEPGEPGHGDGGGRSVWWTWTAPANGTLTIDTRGSTFDTLLGVYTGTLVSSLKSVASNNNESSSSTASRVMFDVLAGTSYQIAVDGFRQAAGDITLNLDLNLQKPKAPGGVSASNGAHAGWVRVDWSPSAGATAYEVWRASSRDSNAAIRVGITGTATSFDDASAVPGQTYWYWIKARNGAGPSGLSASDSGYR